VVTADGEEVSRRRALCRALVAWMPIAVFVILIAGRMFIVFALERPAPFLLRGPVFPGTALAGLAVFVVGGVRAACLPARGLQDWLTGTWLVPR
jgi:hypothetical protein